MRTVRHLIILAIAAVGIGCGGSLPSLPNLPTSADLATAEGNVLAATGNLQQLLTLAAELTNTVSKIEDTAARAGAVPPVADAAFDRAMLAYAEASSAATAKLQTGSVKTWPELRALVEPVLARGQALIETARQLGTIRGRLENWLTTLRDTFMEIVGQFIVARNLGGAQ